MWGIPGDTNDQALPELAEDGQALPEPAADGEAQGLDPSTAVKCQPKGGPHHDRDVMGCSEETTVEKEQVNARRHKDPALSQPQHSTFTIMHMLSVCNFS